MRIVITGACGFVGSRLALGLRRHQEDIEVVGIDNLLRPGSEQNRALLAAAGIRYVHGDVRLRSDIESLPSCDWVIDAAANPSVLAGVDGKSSPRQLNEHNLLGTLNVLEHCRQHSAGFVLMSTSRVYSVQDLAALPIRPAGSRFELDLASARRAGLSQNGLREDFPVRQPISLYGATKLSSEIMAIEYGHTFGFPVWVNRCGVLAGARQFGTAEQGIFSYWIHAHAGRHPLRYIGFGGLGYQVRDAFHPDDLSQLLLTQLRRDPPKDSVFNIGGGRQNSMSLGELTAWCDDRFGKHIPVPDSRERPFDIPWVVMDSARAQKELGWNPERSLHSILEEIAEHTQTSPDWLKQCGAI